MGKEVGGGMGREREGGEGREGGSKETGECDYLCESWRILA